LQSLTWDQFSPSTLMTGPNSSQALPLKRLLIERAEGNPFFLEELVRSLVETGVLIGERGQYRIQTPVSNIRVPPAVQAVIASRIDRLPPVEKRLLQEASVIGKDVPFSLLEMITDAPNNELRRILDDLQDAEFIYESQLFPALEYTFKHSLTHKVAYEELLQDRRRDIHARIVDSIEKLHAGRLNEQVECLAHHALSGEVWPKALTYLRQAGTKAIDRQANREAVALYQQALLALKHIPDSRSALEGIDIRFDIRNALQPLGDLPQIIDYLREAEELATRLDDQRRLGWLASYLCEHYRMRGEPELAMEMGERALTIGKELSDPSIQVVTYLPLGLLHHALGRYPQAVELLRENVDRLRGGLEHDRFGLFGLPSVFSRTFMAYCFAELGMFREGIAIGEEGIRIASAADHPFSQVYAYLGTGYVYMRQGHFERAVSELERATNIAQFTQIPVGFAYGASYLGYALTLAGRIQEGLSLLEQTTVPAISNKFIARHALRLACLSEAYLAAGRLDDATTAVNKALEFAANHQERGHQAYVLRLLGDIATCRNKFEDGEKHYLDALQLTQELGMRPLTAHCHRGLARLARLKHDSVSEDRHSRKARQLFRDMEMITWLYLMESDLEKLTKAAVFRS
jgi:tetratricopeptide (TPR) repeat protein